MTEEMPLVSIIIRTKDRPKILKRALKSVAVQIYRPLEVVLVNDGGCSLDKDELQEIICDISLKYIVFEENKGRAAAGNAGIENASGAYIGFLDDDDEYYPEHISALISSLKDLDDFSGAYTDSEIIFREYDNNGEIISERNGGIFKSCDFSYETLLFENYIPINCLLMKKDVLEKKGGFDPSFEMFEDWDFLIRASEQNPLFHIRKVTAKYIQWSKIQQMAFINSPVAEKNYLGVLSKHSSKITPRAAYGYFLSKHGEMNQVRSILQEEINTHRNALYDMHVLLRELNSRNEDMGLRLQETERKNSRLNSKLTEMEHYIEQIESRFRRQLEQLKRTEKELSDKQACIEDIQSGLGWKILEKYRVSVRNRLMPRGTRRGDVYENMIGRFKKVTEEKISSFTEGADKGKRPVSNIKRETINIPLISSTAVEKICKSISVVIPTRNAGHDFHYVLNNIRRQKGIRSIEIIIVDSGSDDDTLSLAERYNAKIFTISPSEFRHGRTRNYGADQASGEFIIFMSQDAIPIGDTCFADMICSMINDPSIAAVSAKQVPRSDADIYSCWENWNHYRNFLRYSGDEVISINPKNFDMLDPDDKRRIAQIDNVFSCIRKDVFEKLKFRDLHYAEDLDLGIRLIKEGYKIGFLASVGAIHSHNRDPVYYFRRSYTDRKALISILGYRPNNWHSLGINSFLEMVHYVQSCYGRIESVLSCFSKNVVGTKEVLLQLDTLSDLFCTCHAGNNGAWKDTALGLTIDELVTTCGDREVIFSASENIVINQFLSNIPVFREHLSLYGDINERCEEAVASLRKLCAVILGANLGDYISFHESKKGKELLVEQNSILGKGV